MKLLDIGYICFFPLEKCGYKEVKNYSLSFVKHSKRIWRKGQTACFVERMIYATILPMAGLCWQSCHKCAIKYIAKMHRPGLQVGSMCWQKASRAVQEQEKAGMDGWGKEGWGKVGWAGQAWEGVGLVAPACSILALFPDIR